MSDAKVFIAVLAIALGIGISLGIWTDYRHYRCIERVWLIPGAVTMCSKWEKAPSLWAAVFERQP